MDGELLFAVIVIGDSMSPVFLEGDLVIFRPVRNGHAFHSRLLDPIVDRFAAEVAQVRLQAPRIPFISNASGTWITAEQAVDPRYWVEHARRTARFSDALNPG